MSDEILEVRNLSVRFYTYAGVVKALEEVSFDVKEGETFGIVGETGCGKSVTALSLMMLTPSPGEIEQGSILFCRNGEFEDLTEKDEDEMRSIRGNEISIIFQEPNEALNPVYSIGDQISESFLTHRREEIIEEVIKDLEGEIVDAGLLKEKILRIEKSLYEKMLENPDSLTLKTASKIPIFNRYENRMKEVGERKAIKILSEVGIPDPEDVVDKYPHEMSGGMNQRAVVSMAIACRPEILIADEPTSNLDVSIQGWILDIINDMKEDYGVSVIHITHNLGVIAEVCDRVAVMYAGEIIEVADVEELFENPLHPYTEMLLESVPSLEKEELPSVRGSVPDLVSPPSGCRFNPRCPKAAENCSKDSPSLRELRENHYVACHRLKVKNDENTA